MIKKLVFSVIPLVFLTNLIFAQTTTRGIVAETIVESESTLGKPEIKFQTGHSDAVNSVCFSPNGKYIVSGSEDNTVKLWDVKTGKEIETFGKDGEVTSVQFTPNGEFIVFCQNGDINIWDYENKETSLNIDIRTFSDDFAISSCGNYIVCSSANGITYYDIKTGNVHKIFTNSYTEDVYGISVDGKYIASGSWDETIKLWDARSGKEIRTFTGHTDLVRSVNFSPDGKYVVSGSWDETIKLWDVESGKEIRTFTGHTSYVNSVSFSLDGKYIASGSCDKTIKLWDVESGKEIRTFIGHTSYVNSVSFSPDGKYIASGSEDNSIKLWNTERGNPVDSYDCNTDEIKSLYLNSREDTLISINKNSNTITLWDIKSGKKLNSINNSQINSSDFCSVGNLLSIVSNESIKIINLESNKVISEIIGCFDYSVFSPNGRMLIIGKNGKHSDIYGRETKNPEIQLWDIDKNEFVDIFIGKTNGSVTPFWSSDKFYLLEEDLDWTGDYPIVKVAIYDFNKTNVFNINSDDGHCSAIFSKNAKWFANAESINLNSDSLWDDKIIRIWDVTNWTEKLCLTNHYSNIRWMEFSPDESKILSIDGFGIQLFDIYTNENNWRYSTPIVDGFSIAQFSNDSKTLAVGGSTGEIILLDVVSGTVKAKLIDHSNTVNNIYFCANNKLVSSSADGTVKLWDVETGELIYTIINGKDGEWLTYTPEGFFTGSEWATKNLVHIVDGLEVIGIDQVYDKLYRPDLVAAKMRGENISMYAKDVNLASLVRSGSVPVVTLENLPENPTSRDITFNVCVKNTGGGIGKVNLVLNGKTIQLSEGIESSTGQTVNFEHTITLQNGENTIEAFAHNGSGLVESRRPSSIISWEGKTTKPNLYVLTLAINKYRDKSLWLNYCVSDANAIAESFKSQESGLYENVYVSSLQDGEVTKEGISEEFKRLSSLVSSDDVFIFYISGHGTTYDDGDYYYLPVNIRYTSREEIPIQGVSKNDLIENLSLIKAGKTLLMLDTCNSGAFFANSGQRGLSEKTAIDRLTRATGHATLAASSDSQSAMEGYEGHGVFTYVLLEGLKGEADSNDDGFVTLLELASYVENEVPERSYEKWGYEQVPQKDLRRQDFPIAGRL